MNKKYYYPDWYNKKVYLYIFVLLVVFNILPFVVGNGSPGFEVFLAGNAGCLILISIYYFGLDKGKGVYLTNSHLFITEQKVPWSDITHLAHDTDSSHGLLLLVPRINHQLGHCLRLTTREQQEFSIHRALVDFDRCVSDIEKKTGLIASN